MKTRFDIEDPLFKNHLKENPFTLPHNYIEGVKESLSGKIEEQSKKVGIWTILKPQLSLVTAFAIVFAVAYGIFGLSGGSLPTTKKSSLQVMSSGQMPYIEEGFLKTSFIDFFDSSTDSLSAKHNDISQEELLDYINQNVDLVTLSYLEMRD
ncbi:MAG: hypothetical protein EOM16_01230 [Bacteroidia bacterium]|nr:hypothetical protein [Bacteroidia bacterium]